MRETKQKKDIREKQREKRKPDFLMRIWKGKNIEWFYMMMMWKLEKKTERRRRRRRRRRSWMSWRWF
jgi:hypothetical protein